MQRSSAVYLRNNEYVVYFGRFVSRSIAAMHSGWTPSLASSFVLELVLIILEAPGAVLPTFSFPIVRFCILQFYKNE